MKTLALPIRINRDGQFERADPVESLTGLLGVMAATSTRAWPHAPWFGLQEMITSGGEIQQASRLTDAFNVALGHLGVNWARVTALRPVGPRVPGARQFELTLLVDGQRIVHRELAL